MTDRININSDGPVAIHKPVIGSTHMISSGNKMSSLAGLRILDNGGNAVDAGVAAGITINVTQPHLSSFGGVAPMMIYLANERRVVTISGVGRWPQSITLKSFSETYKEIPKGLPRSVVPAACDAWLTALEEYGTISFEEAVAPALELAENGFTPSRRMCNAINKGQEWLNIWPYYKEVFAPNGLPIKSEDLLKQGDLAKVFRAMIDVEKANRGKGRKAGIRATRDFFYKGLIAKTMVSYCEQQDGFLTKDDFSKFSVQMEEPEKGGYRGYDVYTCGVWCQGPALISILNILEGYDLKSLKHNSASYIHLIVEAIKLAFADRHSYYGDPDLIQVPIKGLLSKEYAKERRKLLDITIASQGMPAAGNPWPYEGLYEEKPRDLSTDPLYGSVEPDTSYTCVVDRWGNAISAMPSDGFGTTPLIPGLGMIISPRGRQTWLEENHPSSLAPWKRPRLTPAPSIICKDGNLLMPFGTPGGDLQIQVLLQMLLNVVDFQLNPQQAAEQPRIWSTSFPDSGWPHSYRPGHLNIEGRVPLNVTNQLEEMGHQVQITSDWGQTDSGICAIMIDEETGKLMGVADPRSEAYAIGR